VENISSDLREPGVTGVLFICTFRAWYRVSLCEPLLLVCVLGVTGVVTFGVSNLWREDCKKMLHDQVFTNVCSI